MKKNICKFMYILGTVFLFLGTIMSTVTSVVTASTVSSSNESRISREVQKSSSSVNVQRSSKSKSMSTSKMSSREQTTSKVRSQNEHVAVQNLAAGSSSSSSMGGGSIAPEGQTTITSTPFGASYYKGVATGSQGIYYHFHTANGDVVYCYNWQMHAPDNSNGLNYDKYKFFDGMNQVTGNNEQKVDEVAAALEAGYHKDATTGQYEIAPQFVQDAQSDLNNLSNWEGTTLNPGPLYNAVPNDETPGTDGALAKYEEDVTQSVIWYLDGASDATSTVTEEGKSVIATFPGWLATHTQLGKDILNYAEDHPLNRQTAYPQNVAIATTDGGIVGNKNPLVMDPKTKLSQPFKLSNYNGGIDVSGLPSGYEIVNASDPNTAVSQVESGQTYEVRYIGNDDPSSATANQVVGNISAKASYESLKDSNFFSATMDDPVPPYTSGEINQWQNMVNLETTTNSFNFPIIWSSSKSSSSSSKSLSSSSSSKSSSSSSKSLSSSSSSKSTGHKHGKSHGMPQTGEAIATTLVAIGVVLLATAGAITLRKQK